MTYFIKLLFKSFVDLDLSELLQLTSIVKLIKATVLNNNDRFDIISQLKI